MSTQVDTKKDTQRVNIKISPEAHKKAKRLAASAGKGMREYFDAVIAYFYRTGYDPTEFSSASQNKALGGIKRQLDFLVRMQKTSEKSFIRPMAEAMLSLESSFHTLSASGALTQSNVKNNSAYPAIDPLSCPMCQKIWHKLMVSDEEDIYCDGCSFKLPLAVGNLVFSSLDVYTLISGGYTRIFEGFTHEGVTHGPLRFMLHSSGRIRMVRNEG